MRWGLPAPACPSSREAQQADGLGEEQRAVVLAGPPPSAYLTGGRSKTSVAGQSKSPSLAPPTKAAHSPGVNTSAGPAGCLELRTAT